MSMTGQLLINGTDAWTAYSVFLEEGSIDKLLLPPPVKPGIENKSRSVAGKQVLVKTALYDERDVTLVFCFAKNATSFSSRVASLMSALIAGYTVNSVLGPTAIAVGALDKVFYMQYVSCVELSSADNAIGKVAVRFNEPDPTNRGTISIPQG